VEQPNVQEELIVRYKLVKWFALKADSNSREREINCSKNCNSKLHLPLCLPKWFFKLVAHNGLIENFSSTLEWPEVPTIHSRANMRIFSSRSLNGKLRAIQQVPKVYNVFHCCHGQSKWFGCHQVEAKWVCFTLFIGNFLIKKGWNWCKMEWRLINCQ
jgi:hypothetical protein